MKCFLSNSPITDQSTGKKYWTSLTPATPSIIYPYFPYHLPFHTYFSCPEQHYTVILFSPQLIIIHSPSSFLPDLLWVQLQSLFFSTMSLSSSETSLSLLPFCPTLLLNVSSLTRVQWVCNPGLNPPSQLKGHLFDLNFTVPLFFSFLFPSPLWPPLSTPSTPLCGFILALLIHSMHSSKILLILLQISVSFWPYSLPSQLFLLCNTSLTTVIRGKIPLTHNNLESSLSTCIEIDRLEI